MTGKIEITRFWLDATGAPHREEAHLRPVPEGHPRGHRIDLGTIEGEASVPVPVPDGPLRVVAVTDPAVPPGVLALDLNTLYELPLVEGARLIARGEWEQVTAARAAAEDETMATMTDQIAALLAPDAPGEG